MNLNRAWMTAAALGALTFLFAPVCLAQFQCEQKTDARNTIICAPPQGDLVRNRSGKYVCGPGQCVVNSSSGEVICSAAPGGLAALDSRGEGLCVEGCVAASESLCVTPVPDPS